MIGNAFKKGINKGILNWRGVIILWLVNFLFSMILFLPSSSLFSKAFSKGMITEKMVKGDLSIFLEFMTIYKNEIGVLFSLSFSLFLIYWLVNLFLSGGIISILKEERKNVRDIFTNAPHYFWRFIKLSLLFIPLMILFLIIWRILGKLREFFFNLTDSEILTFYFSLLIIFITILIFFNLRILFDYGRIRIVFEEERVVTISLLRTVKFVFKNFWKTFLLYIILTISLLLYYIPIYLVFKISVVSPIFALLIFLLSQLLLLFRSFISFLFYSAQTELYRSLRA